MRVVERRAVAGFEMYYVSAYSNLRRLAWLLTHSDELAEDITQEALLSVYRRYDRIDNPDQYARRVVVNLAKTSHRRAAMHSRKWHLLDRPAHTELGDAELADIVARLSHRQRVVIIGRYWADWSEAEIAGVLGCRPGTVKSLASRALARIREELGGTDD